MNWWPSLSVCLLLGCTTPYQPRPVATVPDPAPLPAPPVVQVVSAPVREHWPMLPSSKHPMKLIEQANDLAVIRPSAFNRASAELPYCDGCVYQLDTAPERPTTLVFGPKEEWRYTSVTGERWQIKEVTDDLPFRIVIAATEPTLRTRMTVITNQRAYYLDLRANPKTSLVEVRWEQPPAPAPPVAPAARYGIGYGLSDGSYSWRPAYLWDNGLHTFVLFPETLPSGDVPVVGIRSRGLREIVNYQLYGRVMRIHRMIDATEAIEFVVGVEQPRVMEARRTDAYRLVTCPGEALCDFLQGWLSKESAIATHD